MRLKIALFSESLIYVAHKLPFLNNKFENQINIYLYHSYEFAILILSNSSEFLENYALFWIMSCEIHYSQWRERINVSNNAMDTRINKTNFCYHWCIHDDTKTPPTIENVIGIWLLWLLDLFLKRCMDPCIHKSQYF